MENNCQENGKLIKMFCVVGLDETKLTKYNEDNSLRFIQKIDIIKKKMKIDDLKFENTDEKWMLICKKNNLWLRVAFNFTYNHPITLLKFLECEYDTSDSNYLLYKKSYLEEGFYPIYSENTDLEELEGKNDNISILDELTNLTFINDMYVRIPCYCNINNIFSPNKTKPLVIAINRELNRIPLKDVTIKYEMPNITKLDPYKHVYLPEIIDVYPLDPPPNPGYAMFCFPEGIKIIDHMITPKIFSFILTDENGKRSYASCLIITEEITESLIFSFVPVIIPEKQLYVEKALCLIGSQPSFHNYKEFLKELYRIQLSNLDKPLERIICHFVDSIYTYPDKSLSYYIGNIELKFYNQPIYAREWDTSDENIEFLFIRLSIDNILLLWEGLLLERQIFLVSNNSKMLLTDISLGLISLIFPFKWDQATIPILPEKLRVFVESPVPTLIGIPFFIENSIFPSESIVINIDKNSVEKYLDKMPSLPVKLKANLIKRLEKYKYKYNNMDDSLRIMTCDEAFNITMDIFESKENFDCLDIRDIFFEFFVNMFKNYEKYFSFKNKKLKEKEILEFNREIFLKDHSSNDPGSFLEKFTETMMFQQFIDNFLQYENKPEIQFFIQCIKKEKKNDFYMQYYHPTLSSVVPDVSLLSIEKKRYTYKLFPKLNSDLYIKIDAPKMPYQSKFLISNDEWCYDVDSLNKKDWAKYLYFVIHEIWYQLFCINISLQEDKKAGELIEHAIFILNELTQKKKILPSRSLYMKLIRACGRSSFANKVTEIWNTMPSNYKQNNPLYYNAFMNGVYDLDNSFSDNYDPQAKVNLTKKISYRRSNTPYDDDKAQLIYELISNSIFVCYEICPSCYKNNRKRKMSIDEILGGFKRNTSCYFAICSICLFKFFPKLYIINSLNKTTIEIIETMNLLSPVVLLKEVDNLIKNRGEKYFFSPFYIHKEQKHIFWNIVYYFKILQLPLYVMTPLRNDSFINPILVELTNIRDSSKVKKPVVKSFGTVFFENQGISVLNKNYDNNSSVISTPIHKANISNKEWENIYFKIINRIELYLQKNPNPEKVADDQKNDLNNNIAEIKNLFSKYIEEFTQLQIDKLEYLCNSFIKEDILFSIENNEKKEFMINEEFNSKEEYINSNIAFLKK